MTSLVSQALASFLLVLGESEEAGVAMERSLSLWLPQHTAWAATGEGEQTNLSYDTRLASVKVLLDLERFDTAAEILDSLLEEDNEVREGFKNPSYRKYFTWKCLTWIYPFLPSRLWQHGIFTVGSITSATILISMAM